MKKNPFFFFAAMAFMATILMSCTEPVTPDPEPGGDEPQEQVKLEALKLNVPVVNNWVWDAKPEITIEAENPNAVEMEAAVKVIFTTDKGKAVETVEFTEMIPAKGKKKLFVTTTKDLEPGFYKARCMVNLKTPRTFTFGISPYDVVSAPDMQPDFDEYWENAKKSLQVHHASCLIETWFKILCCCHK